MRSSASADGRVFVGNGMAEQAQAILCSNVGESVAVVRADIARARAKL